MPQAVRIIGKTDVRNANEYIQAQVDALGNLHTREGAYPGLCKTYEDTSFVAGDSPVTHNFYSDTDRFAIDGYLICDGAGNIQVDYSRDGVVYSDKFTVKNGETVSLLRLDIKTIRITHTGTDSAYRILMV